MQRSWEDLEHVAATATEETTEVDFKQSFTGLKGEWCELLKDVVAIANSGGGVLLIGVADDGSPSLFDARSLSDLDPAVVTDKLRSYIGRDFAEFRLRPVKRGNHTAFAILIGSAGLPVVFVNPGTYEFEGKQRTAFGRGTVFFRHGAKSEPANSHDMAAAFEREIERVRSAWLENVRRVVEAPLDAKIVIEKASGVPQVTHGGTEAVRLTNDPGAERVRAIDPNETHPFRQKELLAELRQRLPEGTMVTGFDILALREVHGLDGEPSYVYKPKFGSRQYSRAMADWIVEQITANPSFFLAAREAYSPPRAE